MDATQLLAKKYSKTNLKDIPLENASLKVASMHSTNSSHFSSISKEELEPGKENEWHTHEAEDELIMVLQGSGKFYWKEELVDYTDGDIFMIPNNTLHKIAASGDKPSQFLFIRVKL